MTSRLLWVWERRPRPPLELLGANLYVYFSLAFLVAMPLRVPAGKPVRVPVVDTG